MNKLSIGFYPGQLSAGAVNNKNQARLQEYKTYATNYYPAFYSGLYRE